MTVQDDLRWCRERGATVDFDHHEVRIEVHGVTYVDDTFEQAMDRVRQAREVSL